ncbi:Acetyltransferase (GNAT) family protein [Caldanaerovirga acetigignens]|jgi:ribosomal protein S18 acetylase RimI-like enzyme|uniref:Acetyltransferase (GNAT) family protein n=1 Tax=Caldanaerovirga acetigignens TaxID=447595 RepID=A0A1M7KQK1_9FIRM|nr:N-acetyltransferase [Caldanaerovirga acetigignens]SHM67784.1 Acetyltransferase (GNAT) family protein [Caldanaerovirga acetigignens]
MVRIVTAKIQHIEAVVDIFCAAFHKSITFFTPDISNVREAFKDFFGLLMETFNGGFMVALNEGEVCGYIIMADDVRRLWVKAIFSGFIFKIAAKALRGIYGIGLATIYKVVKNKLYYLKFEISTEKTAQLLSIAVHPSHHGKGIGKKLLEAGLKYIKCMGIKKIKLEVRPDNKSALSIYEKYGFQKVGKAKDLQGDWLIMVKEL